jgi:hypothetical protein
MHRAWKSITGIAIVSTLVLLFYLWLVSLGLWTDFPPSTNYYDLQATAFSHGQLALEVQPNAALLALENPYEPGNREGIPVLWDATLYEGKYYLYWGPAPAILLAVLKLFYSREIGDNILTFLFLCGAFLFLVWIIVDLWKTYFPEIPGAILLGSIALAGLINPLPFVLIEARIYEAAIAAGQFFFLCGLYFLFSSFHRPHLIKLVLCGLCFTFTVGSRTTLVFPIFLLLFIFSIWAFRNHKEQMISFFAVLLAPLVIGALAYAWYNFARFGSFTEFGYAYQLTGFNINASIGDTFSLAYIPPNLFKTLLNPLEWKEGFPFFKPALWGGPESWLRTYNPKIYYYLAEGVTGLLIGSPFLIFAFLRKRHELFWISISLTGSALLLFLLTQVFFYTTMRYLLDLVPALTLLAILGFWSGYDSLKNKMPIPVLAVTLWAYTILIGVLLPFSSNVKRFREYNPEFIQHITNLFQ